METIKGIFSSIASVIFGIFSSIASVFFGSVGTSLSDVQPNNQVFIDESHDSTNEAFSESPPVASVESIQAESIQACHKYEKVLPESAATSRLQLQTQETPVTGEAHSQSSYGLLESNLDCGETSDLKFEALSDSTQPTHEGVSMVLGQGGNLEIHGESSVFSVDNSLSMETFAEIDPMSSSVACGTIASHIGEDRHSASMLTTDASTENSPKKVTNALKKLEGFFNPGTSVASKSSASVNEDDDNENVDDDKHSLTKKRKNEADESPKRKEQRTAGAAEAEHPKVLERRRYEHAVQVVMDDLMRLYYQNNERLPYRSMDDAVKRLFCEFGYTCTKANILAYKQMYIKKNGVIKGVKVLPYHDIKNNPNMSRMYQQNGQSASK